MELGSRTPPLLSTFDAFVNVHHTVGKQKRGRLGIWVDLETKGKGVAREESGSTDAKRLTDGPKHLRSDARKLQDPRDKHVSRRRSSSKLKQRKGQFRNEKKRTKIEYTFTRTGCNATEVSQCLMRFSHLTFAVRLFTCTCKLYVATSTFQ